jgi:thiol-disulfide isomerase/thioredoxin
MTDEERQKLIKRLREVMFMSTSYEPLCKEAAKEIERLAAENKRLEQLEARVEALGRM